MIMIRYDMPLAAPRRYILYNSLFPLFLLVDLLSLSIIPYLPRVTPLSVSFKCLRPGPGSLYTIPYLFYTPLSLTQNRISLHSSRSEPTSLSRATSHIDPGPEKQVTKAHNSSQWLDQRRSSVSHLTFAAIPIYLVPSENEIRVAGESSGEE
jgi:hypothetical protein